MTTKVDVISLSDYTPETFEEWCEIHGEPEYLHEVHVPTKFDILVEDCEKPVEPIDVTELFINKGTTDKPNYDVNYPAFIDHFRGFTKCVYCNGTFYTPDGMVSCQTVRSDVANLLKDAGWKGKLDVPTNSIFASLKDITAVERLKIDEKIIPLANGDLDISKKQWVFKLGEKLQAPYRLAVNFSPIDKPMPLFNKWLNDVFEPDDITTIQEIFGYCLIPTTAVQEAFFLVGDAGTGKSGMGTILEGLLGNAFETMETQQLVTERFQIAKVENKLVVYDDDLGSSALRDTGTFKKLITADQEIPAERKYGDPYTFRSFAKVVASTNVMLTSLFDDSDGFYRRLHPVHVKKKDEDRKPIRNFYQMILEQEKPQILRWALKGLKRVIENGWEVHWSQRSREYMGDTKARTTPFEDFLSDCCELTSSGDVTTAELQKAFELWTKSNGLPEISKRRFSNWISDNSERLNLKRDKNIKRNNKKLRGYRGIIIKEEWNNCSISL